MFLQLALAGVYNYLPLRSVCPPLPDSNWARLGSFSEGMDHIFLPEGPFVILPGLSCCCFSLPLMKGMVITRDTLNNLLHPRNNFTSIVEKQPNHPLPLSPHPANLY